MRQFRSLGLMALLLSCSLAGLSGRARAEAELVSADETARLHHDEGQKQSALGHFESAIAEYRKAYEIKADPAYLFDIAEAYRALDVPERAVFFYRRYLSTHPNPPNRSEVESRLAVLEPRVHRDAAPSPAPAGLVAGPELALHGNARPVSEHEHSVIGKWWFWTAIGALAAAGATVAIVAAGHGSGTSIPTSELGHAKLQ